MNNPSNHVRPQKIATPWGQSHFVRHLNEEGTVFKVGTDEHGGIGVNSSEVLPPALAQLGDPDSNGVLWFEEDLAWSAVAVARPELFPGAAQDAIETLREYFPTAHAAYFDGAANEGATQ